MVEEIKELSSDDSQVSFSLVKGSANKVADWVAKAARADNLSSVSLRALLDEDNRWSGAFHLRSCILVCCTFLLLPWEFCVFFNMIYPGAMF